MYAGHKLARGISRSQTPKSNPNQAIIFWEATLHHSTLGACSFSENGKFWFGKGGGNDYAKCQGRSREIYFAAESRGLLEKRCILSLVSQHFQRAGNVLGGNK